MEAYKSIWDGGVIFRVKNWRQFQHYKDRNPPWIKLHFSLLTSADWVALDDMSRVLAIVCMLIASKNEGQIDGSPTGLAYLQRVAYLNKKPNLTPLIDCGFLESASKAEQKIPNAIPETEGLTENLTDKSNVGLTPDPTTQGRDKQEKTRALRAEAVQILAFLNEKTGHTYEPVPENIDRIVARLKGGTSADDVRSVIALKCRQWSADEKMAKYLRPKTLFAAENFANYKGELRAV